MSSTFGRSSTSELGGYSALTSMWSCATNSEGFCNVHQEDFAAFGVADMQPSQRLFKAAAHYQ
eukprot:2635048-Amphidinium_carterae.1